MASSLQVSSAFVHSPCSLHPPYKSTLLPNSASCPRVPPCLPRASPLPVSCCANAAEHSGLVTRREFSLATFLVTSFGTAGTALADADEDYKRETVDVIEQVRLTLSLDKTDPNKAAAVAKLRQAGNEWVAKYRKAKKVAGKPSFSNMYSVINAISGHFVSFGATYPIPAKRKDRILDEIKDAEKALSRGR